MTAIPMKYRLDLGLVGFICFGAGSLYGWSALVPALKERFNVGHTEAGQVFSLAIVAFSGAVLIAPYLPSIWRGTRGCAIAGYLAAALTAGAAFAPNYPLFLLFYSFGFGIMSGAIYIFGLEIATQSSFSRLATPMMVAAFGLGGVVFGPVLRQLAAVGLGLRALLVVTVVLVLAAICVGRRHLTSKALAAASQRAEQPADYGVAWSSIPFLWIIFVSGSGAGLMTLGLTVNIIEDRGATSALSALALAGVALGNTCGRLSVGIIARSRDPIVIVGLSPMIGIAGLLGLLLLSTPQAAAMAVTVVAFGYGTLAAAMPVLTGSIVGAQAFGKTFAIVFTGWGAAGLLSPWIAGAIRDATGNFDFALYLAMTVCVISVLATIAFGVGMRRHSYTGKTTKPACNGEDLE